jgi:hypothetical protein
MFHAILCVILGIILPVHFHDESKNNIQADWKLDFQFDKPLFLYYISFRDRKNVVL